MKPDSSRQERIHRELDVTFRPMLVIAILAASIGLFSFSTPRDDEVWGILLIANGILAAHAVIYLSLYLLSTLHNSDARSLSESKLLSVLAEVAYDIMVYAFIITAVATVAYLIWAAPNSWSIVSRIIASGAALGLAFCITLVRQRKNKK